MSQQITKFSPVKRPGRGPRIAGLTRREAEVLRLLYQYRDKLHTPYTRGEAEPGWCRPHDIGGKQQSHHSNTLRRLVGMGFVLAKPYINIDSHAKIYHISESGLAAWDLYAEHERLARQVAEPRAQKKNGTMKVPSLIRLLGIN